MIMSHRRPGLLLLLLLAASTTMCTLERRETTGIGRPDQDRTPLKIQAGYVSARDGARLYYQKVGSGRQTVVVPMGWRLFDDFQHLANSRRTVIFYDPRDRGRSDTLRDDSMISVRHDVDDLEIVRQHFGADRISLLAVSSAAPIAALYAREYPGRVERVVLLDPIPMHPRDLGPGDDGVLPQPVTPAARSRLRSLRASGYADAHPREYCEQRWILTRERLVADPAHVDQLGESDCYLHNEWPAHLARHDAIWLQSLRALHLGYTTFRELSVPLLVLHGKADELVSLSSAREWAVSFPRGRIVPIQQAGHYSWIDQPDIVFPSIELFLNERPVQHTGRPIKGD